MLHQLHFHHEDQAHTSFDLRTFGQIEISDCRLRLGFQIDVVPSLCPSQLLFGLATLSEEGAPLQSGFAVRIDLERGEIWDALNDTGLIGWIETGPLGMDRYSDEEPMLLSLEVERTGKVLIPTLRVGDDEWLYPSLPSTAGTSLTAVAGFSTECLIPSDPFLHPALWQEVVR